ncbi:MULTISPECIES: 3-keto-disaccharide hydrolase [Sphingobacterium]|uniref:DUF1080 domain-containing protein n=1 Tax=Sphingobacterium ginsenosidimutans TaxID=687845 RepID=A0ABP8AKI9_9SPHI|nr:DUF1080 domain-containing protein [Sphingobacterium sp. E70]ULT22744.1 DUF1080 domain-containing protein [Sphingobacterium sp. E70]
MNFSLSSALTLAILCGSSAIYAQTNMKPSDTEYYKPVPPTVTLNKGIPSDAIVLFDGKDLSKWKSEKGNANWTIANNTLEVKPGTGNIETTEHFGDFQLHIEWKSPELIKGEGQGRGNSGIFLQGLYEIQVLDNNNNPTYVNGGAGSLYKQRPPLAQVIVTDKWHVYDIIYKAPQFNKDSLLISKGTVTVLHNGVLVQNNTQIDGTTEYIGLPKQVSHGPGPIILQDHGDLVQFRNIWLRKL